MSNEIRVLLTDDHHLFLMGIDSILRDQPGIQVVGHASNGQEAVTKARELQPDVILMDINMPVCNGISATKLIKEQMPHVKVLMLTVNDGDEELFEAIKAGADGYLLKNLMPEDLRTSIKSTSEGQVSLSGLMAKKIFRYFREHKMATGKNQIGKEDMPHYLTPREVEILQYVIRGLTNREIAEELCISENTVKNHLRNVMEKLHMQNRVQAAAYALNVGLIDLD